MNIEERRSSRTYPDSERIAWRRHDGGPLRSARVLNVSVTGIALAFEGALPLHHGELIRTLSRRAGLPRSARIVRIEEDHKSSQRETRLGCRWVTGPRAKQPRAFSRPPKDWEHWTENGECAGTQENAA